MLTKKNLKYIFDRLINERSVLYEVLDDERIAFTDGVRIFIFSKEQIKFDITRCAVTDKLKEVIRGAAAGVEIKPSDECRANDTKGKMYRKLTANTGAGVWVEDKFTQDYKGCIFIGTSLKKPVCAIDDYGDMIAAIMPYDIEGRADYEGDDLL